MLYSKDRQIVQGDPRILGVTRIGSGYNFAVAFDTKEEISLLLYKKGTQELEEEILIPRECYKGKVAAFVLPGFQAKRYEYNYKVGDKILQDPCAVRIVGKRAFGELELDREKGQSHRVRCGFDVNAYDWEGDRPLERPYSDMILYKVHVRGYTSQKNSRVRHKGTFRGIMEKISYFQELGITALELMPVYDFEEVLLPGNIPLEFISKMKETLRLNYWGYARGNYFAPKPAYCAGKDAVTEFKDLVKALHQAGLECILEFYFPAGSDGLRVVQVLRHWHLTYHVDGFHLLGDGVPVELICSDSVLGSAKLMFLGVPGSEIRDKWNPKDRTLAEYNEGFKQDMRRFLKSDEDSLNDAVERMRRNPIDHAVINYITSQDGFTLMDLVSYDVKHNEANGEANRDGTSYNFSWNCGVEGPSRRASVKKLRSQQLRNAILFLMLSQGVPMLYGGDEFGNSQQGNNNAYCQDNEIGWVDWRAFNRNKELVEFVKEAIAFRKSHKIFHMDSELRVMDYKSLGYPDLSYHSTKAWYAARDNVSYHIGLMYCGDYAVNQDGSSDDYMYVAYNFHWEPHDFALPKLPEGKKWCRVLDSGGKLGEGFFLKDGRKLENQKMVEVKARSIEIYIGQQEKK